MRDELYSELVRIRRYRAEDIPLLFEAARESISEEFGRWMPWCHPHYSLDDSSAFILSREAACRNGEAYDFAVFDREDGAFLGGVGVNQLNREHGFANLGYWVRASARGRGVAAAAARLAARFAFEDLGLNRIEIVIAAENGNSQRAAQRAGAQREELLRSRLLIAGRLHDAVMYSLVAADLNI